MSKKLYRNPIIVFDLDDGGDASHTLPGSQVPVGTDTQFEIEYEFSGLDQDIIDAILDNCDDYDLKDMAAGDLRITSAEFYTWLESNQWFEQYL